MELIRFENVSKYFDKRAVISNVNLTINSGETIVLLGPSGCGKTTLLRLINRLLTPEKGTIWFQGEDIQVHDPFELRRKMGYVIQDVGLFPHFTIRENILIPLKIRKEKPAKDLVSELLDMVGLESNAAERYPDALSGGQQQRVGIARALANDPQLILMDEPFSALDNITRTQLQDDFLRLENLLKKTTVLVTHDIHEAFRLADRIVLLDRGVIQQTGTPLSLLREPSNDFVATFLQQDRLLLEMQHQEYPLKNGRSSTVLEALDNDDLPQQDKLEVLLTFLDDLKPASK